MRLLVVEDNKKLSKEMVETMTEAGYSVDFSYTGNEGEEKASINKYDAILLDLNLPDADGMDVLHTIRNASITTPVIIISARDELEDRTSGLDLGADDYPVKPFQLSELKSRVNALIRRSYGHIQKIISIGSLNLNSLSRIVMWNDTKIELTAKEFDILEYFAMTHPKVVSAETLVEDVYDESFDPFS